MMASYTEERMNELNKKVENGIEWSEDDWMDYCCIENYYAESDYYSQMDDSDSIY